MTEEFSERGIPQYWDEERLVSLEAKERVVPALEKKVPWDMLILFGPEATWADAEKQVLGRREPGIDRAQKLEALLSVISAKKSGKRRVPGGS